MKRFLLFLLIFSSIFVVSCRDAGDKPAPEKAVKKHPWDWVPEDAVLASGREVYMAECALCHNEGEEGAPALTKADEWEKRNAKGLPELLDHAINGFNGPDGEMPARGGSDHLTDDQVTAAVKYMLAISK